MENHTAKHFVLQLGSLISLYLSAAFLLVLLFGLINIIFPNAADSFWQTEQSHSSVRIGIAMVIVFFPTYLTLTRLVNKNRRKEKNHSYLSLTKWLIYLSLLAGGLALLIDLVVVIMTFLEGDITQRFILKAVSLLIVIGAAFYYYLLDSRGYWIDNEKKSIMFAIGAIVIVLASLSFGLTKIETPCEAREQRIDQQQISDLQDIQWQIQDYLSINGKLPDLAAGEMSVSKNLLRAPEGRPNYSYNVTDTGFELCAQFSQPSQDNSNYYGRPIINDSDNLVIINPDSWEHEGGEVCFERVVK